MSSAKLFSREDTKLVKGFAILLMLYHHLFAFPNRIQDGSSYISLFSVLGIDSAELLGLFGKMCVALFLFWADMAHGCRTRPRGKSLPPSIKMMIHRKIALFPILR